MDGFSPLLIRFIIIPNEIRFSLSLVLFFMAVRWLGCCRDVYATHKGVTILLSLTVFLNMVAETMPATSDVRPI